MRDAQSRIAMSEKLKSFSCGTWRMALKPNSEELGLLMLILAGLAFKPEPLESSVIVTCLISIPASYLNHQHHPWHSGSPFCACSSRPSCPWIDFSSWLWSPVDR